MTTVEAGTTIVLRVTFTDTDDELSDVTTPTLKIYDDSRAVILTDTENVTRESLGIYSCAYPTPHSTVKQRYYAEFSGTIDGNPIVSRSEFKTEFDL